MFRMGLLTSTAMTAVALLLSGAVAQAQTDMHIASHDPNTRFLCTYGQFAVTKFSSNLNFYSGWFSSWQRVAVRVTGHGQTVRSIRVIEAQASQTSNSAFTLGIYSNTASGFPGKAIAVGTGTAGPTCGPVNVSVLPTKLYKNTKYWIEERATTPRCSTPTGAGSGADRRKFRPTNCVSSAAFSWEADPKTKRKAYVQSHRETGDSGTVSSSYTSPWAKQESGPYLKLK